MKIARLLHTSLHVPNELQACQDFYGRLLGLTELNRPELDVPGVWYGVGGSQLHLNARTNVAPGPSHPRHLCFGVSDLEELRTSLQRAGHEVVEAGSLGVRQLWSADPSGNVLEFQKAGAKS